MNVLATITDLQLKYIVSAVPINIYDIIIVTVVTAVHYTQIWAKMSIINLVTRQV